MSGCFHVVHRFRDRAVRVDDEGGSDNADVDLAIVLLFAPCAICLQDGALRVSAEGEVE